MQDEDISRVLEMTALGLSTLQIAQKFNTYSGRIREIQRQAGVESRFKRALPVDKLLEAWKDGCHDAEIARRAGVTQTAVKKWRESEGLKRHVFDRSHIDYSPVWDQKKARQLYDKGLSDARIAVKVGVSSATIGKWRRSIGLSPNYRKSINSDSIMELYKQGLNDSQIARKLNSSAPRIRKWRERNSLPQNIISLDEDEALKLYQEGLIDREIAERMGITRTMVVNWRKRTGLRANGGSVMDMDVVREMWEDGKNDCEIARHFKVTSGAVRAWRIRNGLPSNY